MQSRFNSILEAIANVLVGYFVAVATQMIVFPWFGIHVPASSNFSIGAIFTVVSLIRSYMLRRVFNRVKNFYTRGDL